MHQFVFARSNYFKTQGSSLNLPFITNISPDVVVHEPGIHESCYLQNLLKLIDDSDSYIYSVIDVMDDTQASQLLDMRDHLTFHQSWNRSTLLYVFKDIKTDRLDTTAIFMKLDGNTAYTEDAETANKSESMRVLNRKFNKFILDVSLRLTHVSTEVYDGLVAAQVQFTQEFDSFRLQRKKNKAAANKLKTSLKAKLMRFAIYKG